MTQSESTDERILKGLAPYPAMLELYLEYRRRFSSPNFTEPVVIGPNVCVLSNPEGTSMDSSSPDYFGLEDFGMFQRICNASHGPENQRGLFKVTNFEAFELLCAQRLQELKSGPKLH